MTVSQIETNPPGFADWGEIHALLVCAFASMAGRIAPPSSLHAMTAQDLEDLAAAGAVFLHRGGAGQIDACLFAKPGDGALSLSKLAVHPTARGQGLARALIKAARADAQRLGLPALQLQTRIELTENHATFRALGFEETGRFTHPGFTRPTSLIFTCAV